MDSTAWLDGLKAGDPALVRTGQALYAEVTVERVTATQVTVRFSSNHLARYLKRTGDVMGKGTWTWNNLEQPTPTLLADIRERKLRGELLRKLDSIGIRSLATPLLEQIVALIESASEVSAASALPLTGPHT